MSIKVNPDVLNWAISESRIEYSIINNKFPKLDDWIKQQINPTFKQLRDLSDFLKIPFGFMFLIHPPRVNVFEVEFRTINNQLNHRPSKNLEDTLFEMEVKKDWMSEYRREIGYDKIEFLNLKTNDKKFDNNQVFKLLRIERDWFLNVDNVDKAFNFLREKIEELGVLVMVNGVVGENTHRKLDLNEFRAFALLDDYAPLIFINRNDSKTGMIFSLVHEFYHLIFGIENVLNLTEEKTYNLKNEQIINKYTADFLCPEQYIIKIWDKSKSELDNIKYIALKLKVSYLAVAIRLFELGYINENLVSKVKQVTNEFVQKNKSKSTGGDYYLTKNSRVSGNFAKAVIAQTESGRLSFTVAYRLLGVRGKTYDSFRESLKR